MYRTFRYILAIVAIGVTVGAAQLPEELAANRCEEQGEGACWERLANHDGCCFWVPASDRDTTLSWTGQCSGGLAQGPGMLQWWEDPSRVAAPSLHDRGSFRDGKKHGHWVEDYFDGMHAARSEGPYTHGKKHGQWSHDFGGMLILEGPYENDQKHGRWVERERSTGFVSERNFVLGQRQGRWRFRGRDGYRAEGLYVDDKRHGHWVTRHHDGRVEETSYVAGERHGPWVMRYPDGSVEEGSYVAGNLRQSP